LVNNKSFNTEYNFTKTYEQVEKCNISFFYTVLAEQSEKTPLIVTLVIAGFLRGATLVNLNLCISECCTLKKLPSAFGIFMVFKGLCVITMSPLIGTFLYNNIQDNNVSMY